jgi:septal ring factor EnvC (AmiA/AmiB activator)
MAVSTHLRRMRAMSALAHLRALALAGLLATLVAPAAADRAEDKRGELEAVRERIEAVREELAAKRAKRDEATQELAKIEKRIGEIAGQLAELDERIAETRQRLETLKRRRQELEGELESHRATLAQQLRAAHRMGRQPALRLLLRQDKPGMVARALGYYGYLNEARVAAIERARELMAELDKVVRKTQNAQSRLEADRRTLAQKRHDLASARSEREALIARLDASIDDQGERLQQLRAARERLEDLLQRLEAALDDVPAAPLEEKPFASRRGELAWPVGGELRRGFGEARAGGRMHWKGVVIDASEGTQVESVYYGRVVFADWLSGFGQLIIVDHLDGYMSLYGFNQRLLRGEGDWVTPGDPVATVGSSGGRRRAALYFEIRQDGQPVEPTAWLANR